MNNLKFDRISLLQGAIPVARDRRIVYEHIRAVVTTDERFFALYNRHAQTLVKGAEALCELLQGGPGVADAARKIAAYEDEADAIARNLLLLVRRTFITPLDLLTIL